MRWSRTILRCAVVTSTAAVACTFSVPPAQLVDDGAVDTPPIVDALVPDGGMCAAASAECATEEVLRTCAGAGASYTDETCDWGCVPGATAHCGELVPSGGIATSADLMAAKTTGDDRAINGNGTVINGTMQSIGGSTFTNSRVDTTHNATVFWFGDLEINNRTLLGGTRSIVLVAAGDVIINDLIDGRPVDCVQPAAGPGGFVGGEVGMNASGSGGGTGGSTGDEGGGGGGYGSTGGTGAAPTSAQTPGGPAWGTPEIALLAGGGGGGGGGDGGGPIGGGGGAAIQIVALGSITFNSNGAINAGGCGGKGAGGQDSGGGGGAGGTILLEARQITLHAAAGLAVNGGGGGAGAGGDAGQAGQLSRTAAVGGAGPATGGAGGVGGALAGQPGVFNGTRGGGGGGAVGRIRINTRSGIATIDPAAVMSPSLTDAPTTATQGRVNLQ